MDSLDEMTFIENKNDVEMMGSFTSADELPVFLRVQIPSSLNTELSIVEWIDGLREKSSRSDSNIINQDIIGAKWILRRRGHLPNTYNLLELMVKRPNRILSILQQHKLKVYELPVRCLNECVSKVILYWLRQCKIFENSRYQGWNRSQAICFNLILTYYGIILPSITSDKFLLHMRDTFQFAVRKKKQI